MFEYELRECGHVHLGPGGQGLVAGKRVVTRDVCDACREGRKRYSKRLDKAKAKAKAMSDRGSAPSGDSMPSGGSTPVRFQGLGFGLEVEAVAVQLRLTVDQVKKAEARALAKLRSSPALREAYDNYKKAGLPQVEYIRQVLRDLLWRPREDAMAGYQLELMEWHRILDAAERQGVSKQDVDRARLAVERCRKELMQQVGLMERGRERERFVKVSAEPRPDAEPRPSNDCGGTGSGDAEMDSELMPVMYK